MNNLLEVDGLRLTIETPSGSVEPVRDVNFTIRQGEIFGLVGESGSGKSMLIKALIGILPPGAKVHGRSQILFQGKLVDKAEAARVRGRDWALIPQDPLTSLNPVRTIGSQVSDGLRRHAGMGRRESRARAEELLASLGIPDAKRVLTLYPHELSGGMRQRVLIASAIALHPGLLFADEPTTALDVTVQKQILGLIDALRDAHGMSVLLVSHDLAVVAGRADRVAVMYAGALVEVLTGARLVRDSAHPYTRGLMDSHPDLDHGGQEDLRTIPGGPPALDRLPGGCAFAARCAFATEVCVMQEPVLQPLTLGGDHLVACHHPQQAGDALMHRRLASTGGNDA